VPGPARASSPSARALALIDRPGILIAAGIVVAVAAFHLWITPSNPPGFLHDEASMSYNAYELGHTLRDENGGLLPLYIKSFGDYKSPLFTYLLAGTFRVTGPHSEVARGMAALAVLLGVLVLGLIAFRQTRNVAVVVAVIVLAGLTPGLFETGRAAYEVALQPLVIGLLLLALDGAWRSGVWTAWRGIAIGLALVALTYSYAAGRMLAPLLAVALLVFAGKERWQALVAAWMTVGVGLAPIAAYWVRHPGALTERYDQTTFIDSSMSVWTVVSTAVSNYAHDVNLWHWVTAGDDKPYVHVVGSGTLLGGAVLLAAAGLVIILVRQRRDLWWRYVLVATVLSPIPAALTKDRFYGLRLVPFFFLLVVLTIPALAALAISARKSWVARVVVGVLAIAVAVQFVDFLGNYRSNGPNRTLAFNAGVPALLDQGFSGGRTIYVDYDESHALVYARWYAVEHGIPLSRVVRLSDGGVPPEGSIVAVRFLGCDFTCDELARAGDYWLATVGAPPES